MFWLGADWVSTFNGNAVDTVDDELVLGMIVDLDGVEDFAGDIEKNDIFGAVVIGTEGRWYWRYSLEGNTSAADDDDLVTTGQLIFFGAFKLVDDIFILKQKSLQRWLVSLQSVECPVNKFSEQFPVVCFLGSNDKVEVEATILLVLDDKRLVLGQGASSKAIICWSEPFVSGVSEQAWMHHLLWGFGT